MPHSGQLLFGTAGIPHSSDELSTESGIRRIHELGLGCMEVEFVRGVTMTPETAVSLAEVAERAGLVLTAHAPYYVNLNAREPGKVAASRARILRTASVSSLFGARSVVFHAGFYMKDDPGTASQKIKANIELMVEEIGSNGGSLRLRPEVMGRASAFGTLDEVLQLSEEIEGVAPVIDFAHWHARTGAANTYAEFVEILREIEARLGRQALDDMHIHVSGIEYGPRGERRHTSLALSDFNYVDLLRALKDTEVSGLVICESPLLEYDALILKKTYDLI
jgi:deoxyribonuclease-4